MQDCRTPCEHYGRSFCGELEGFPSLLYLKHLNPSLQILRALILLDRTLCRRGLQKMNCWLCGFAFGATGRGFGHAQLKFNRVITILGRGEVG